MNALTALAALVTGRPQAAAAAPAEQPAAVNPWRGARFARNVITGETRMILALDGDTIYLGTNWETDMTTYLASNWEPTRLTDPSDTRY